MNRHFACCVFFVCVAAPGLLAKPFNFNLLYSSDYNTDIPRLLRQGYSLNEPMEGESRYPLSAVLSWHNGAYAEFLLDLGANPNLFDPNSASILEDAISLAGDTPEGQKAIKKMIAKGANVTHVQADTNYTALAYAASGGYREVVDLLLQKGASRSPRTKPYTCVPGSEIQCSISDMARRGDHFELALYLDGKDTTAFRRSIEYAVINGDVSLLQAHIKNNANLNQKQPISGSSLLHLAVKNKQFRILKALLDAGADPNQTNIWGNSALRYAITDGTLEMGKALVDAGAKTGHRQIGGCGEGSDEFDWSLGYMKELSFYMIEKGAVDPQNPGLIFQSLHGQDAKDIQLAQMLLDRGARPTQSDVDRLELVMNANEYLRKRGHIYKLLDLYKQNMVAGSASSPVTSRKIDESAASRLRAMDPNNRDKEAVSFRRRNFDSQGRIRKD